MKMRFGAIALALAATVTLGGGTPAGAQLPTQDSVTGTVTLVEGGPSFRFDARSGPSGENPTGTITRLNPAGNIEVVVSVTCLTVEGNRATVAAVTGFPLERVVAFLEDNDGTGVDRFLGVSGEISDCPLTPPAGASLSPILSGDLTVVDGSPLPTSKDQCKNGGWRNFGVFKNQGDCVSFVATGGKNPPGNA
jgi:hypothetical protein